MATTGCPPKKSHAVDDLLGTLRARLRREVVHYFENYTTASTATLDEVVDHVAPRVAKDRETVAQMLVHTHLPKLEARGWLEYDRRSEQIRYRGHEAAERLLDDLRAVFD